MNEAPSKLKPEIIIEATLKYHWLIIIPFCIAMLVGSWLVVTLPRIYKSSTVILVQPQRVPSEIVQNLVTSDINARITTLSQRILSRTNLEKIIDEYNLFSGPEQSNLFMETKVNSLRKQISVDVTRGRNRNADSFSISVKGKEPEKIMRIASTLATSFINENLKIREVQVLGTSTFIQDELESMRKMLVQHEKGLKDYRETYMGGLPEQLGSNLSILDNLNEQLTSVQSELREAKIRLSSLEQVEFDAPVSAVGGVSDGEQRPSNLSQLKDQLESYKNRYTDKHPDVVRLKKMIAELEEQLKKVDTGDEVLQSGHSDNDTRLSPAYIRQRRQINSELKRLNADKKELIEQITIYKKRVEDTPKREQELMSLQRDYNNIREAYNSLLGRQLEAQIAVNMEKKQKGEQFRILDPARLPQKPVEPDMRKLFLFVTAAGLGIGGGLVFLLIIIDSSFKEPEEVEAFLDIPVVATLPTILTARDIKINRIKLIGSVFGVTVSIGLFLMFVGLIILKG